MEVPKSVFDHLRSTDASSPTYPIGVPGWGITSAGKLSSNMDEQVCRSWDMCSDGGYNLSSNPVFVQEHLCTVIHWHKVHEKAEAIM